MDMEAYFDPSVLVRFVNHTEVAVNVFKNSGLQVGYLKQEKWSLPVGGGFNDDAHPAETYVAGNVENQPMLLSRTEGVTTQFCFTYRRNEIHGSEVAIGIYPPNSVPTLSELCTECVVSLVKNSANVDQLELPNHQKEHLKDAVLNPSDYSHAKKIINADFPPEVLGQYIRHTL